MGQEGGGESPHRSRGLRGSLRQGGRALPTGPPVLVCTGGFCVRGICLEKRARGGKQPLSSGLGVRGSEGCAAFCQLCGLAGKGGRRARPAPEEARRRTPLPAAPRPRPAPPRPLKGPRPGGRRRAWRPAPAPPRRPEWLQPGPLPAPCFRGAAPPGSSVARAARTRAEPTTCG